MQVVRSKGFVAVDADGEGSGLGDWLWVRVVRGLWGLVAVDADGQLVQCRDATEHQEHRQAWQ